jgi:hypothetical protein
MLDDEGYWLPRVLAGEMLVGTITSDSSGTKVTHADLASAECSPANDPSA